MELWRRVVGVGMWNVAVLRSGGTLHACRRGGSEAWSSGALEARCRCNDEKSWRYGALEALKASRKLWT